MKGIHLIVLSDFLLIIVVVWQFWPSSFSLFNSVENKPTNCKQVLMLTLLTLMCTQVPRFLQLYLKETTSSVESMYLTSRMYDAQPSVWGVLTSSIFISLSFITPTPSHFLSLTLTFSVIINNNTDKINMYPEEGWHTKIENGIEVFLSHNPQSKNTTGGSESGSTMWGHRVDWLPREHDGSGVFGAGPPYHPRQIRKYLWP